MIRLYTEVKGIYGYRRMTLNINSRLNKRYNHKRIYRLMKSVNMLSVIRKKKKHYVMAEPRITAENVLNREFKAEAPNLMLRNLSWTTGRKPTYALFWIYATRAPSALIQ